MACLLHILVLGWMMIVVLTWISLMSSTIQSGTIKRVQSIIVVLFTLHVYTIMRMNVVCVHVHEYKNSCPQLLSINVSYVVLWNWTCPSGMMLSWQKGTSKLSLTTGTVILYIQEPQAAPQSKNAVCAFQITHKLLSFTLENTRRN